MEGPSIVGAYRFLMTRGKGVVMDIESSLFVRAQVSRFGIGPLTSMYWYSETKKPEAIDWRPEVHDSDGLEMWSGNGERLWRPLNNPPRIMISAFSDNNPRGFGLMQRDRVFDHYLDGVYYDKRPSLWLEPQPGPGGEGWGRGSIQLCEIPTDDEIHDNVVAMWVPAEPVPAGAELHLNYKLYWLASAPFPSELAITVATRLGRGGQPGQPRPKGVRKFLVEWLGGPLGEPPLRRQAGARGLDVARNLRPLSADRGRSRRRQRPLARPVRPHRRGDRSGRAARLPQVRRPDADRDLDVPVPSVLSGGACGALSFRPARADGAVRGCGNLENLRFPHFCSELAFLCLVLRLGFSWIFLDSLVRIGRFQWLMGVERHEFLLGPSFGVKMLNSSRSFLRGKAGLDRRFLD